MSSNYSTSNVLRSLELPAILLRTKTCFGVCVCSKFYNFCNRHIPHLHNMSGEIEASSSLRELSARAKVEIGEADVDVEDELDNLKGLLEGT